MLNRNCYLLYALVLLAHKRSLTNIQPVLPFSLNDDWSLMTVAVRPRQRSKALWSVLAS